VVERRLAVVGRVAGGEEQAVAVAQRHVEMLGEMEKELAGRLRPSRLHEAQVPGRHVGFQREVQLAETTPTTPVLQQRSDARSRGRHGHGSTLPTTAHGSAYLTGHGSAAPRPSWS